MNVNNDDFASLSFFPLLIQPKEKYTRYKERDGYDDADGDSFQSGVW